MNESAALFEARPNSRSPSKGSTLRSSPTIAPTNALTSTSSPNCRQFSRRPRIGVTGAVAGERVPLEHHPRQLHRDRARASPPGELVVPREVLCDEPLEARAMRANLLLEDRVHFALLLGRREVGACDPARQIDG